VNDEECESLEDAEEDDRSVERSNYSSFSPSHEANSI